MTNFQKEEVIYLQVIERVRTRIKLLSMGPRTPKVIGSCLVEMRQFDGCMEYGYLIDGKTPLVDTDTALKVILTKNEKEETQFSKYLNSHRSQ